MLSSFPGTGVADHGVISREMQVCSLAAATAAAHEKFGGSEGFEAFARERIATARAAYEAKIALTAKTGAKPPTLPESLKVAPVNYLAENQALGEISCIWGQKGDLGLFKVS